VSPKSGRAVSRAAAEPYKDRLLPLPSFLHARGNASPDDLKAAFRLTRHFLDMHLWSVRQIDPPPTREPLVEMLTRE
jgi:DNA repair protein RecO (recombination protein O)